MSLGTSRITNRGYQTVYTVPAGKRATVNVTAYANSANTAFALAANEVGSYPSSITVSEINAATYSNVGGSGSGIGSTPQIGMYGNYAVIGCPSNNTVRVYFWTGGVWTLQQTISAPSPGGNFGFSVALSGDTLLVGNPNINSGDGAAYRYTRSGTTWNLQNTINHPYGISSTYFGWQVALGGSNGQWMAIGAPYTDYNYTDEGSVAIYNGVSFNGIAFGNANYRYVGSTIAIGSDGQGIFGNFGSRYNAFNSGGSYTEFTQSGINAVGVIKAGQNSNYFAIRLGDSTVRVGTVIGTTWTEQVIINAPSNSTATTWGYHLHLTPSGDYLSTTDYSAATAGLWYYTRSGANWNTASLFQNTLGSAVGGGTNASSGTFGNALAVTPITGTTAVGNPWTLLAGMFVQTNVGTGGTAFGIGSQTQAENAANVNGFVANFGLDNTAINANQTFERTGLVLNAGESLVAANTFAASDIVVQARGFEENA